MFIDTRKSTQAEIRICNDCKAINFDDIFSTDYMQGVSINAYRTVCSLDHIDNTQHGSCSLCELLRSLRSTDLLSSDRFVLLAGWAKSWICYDEDLEDVDLDTQTAVRLVPHDTVILKIWPTEHDIGVDDGYDFLMELSTDPTNKIAAREVGKRVNFELIRSWLRFCRKHHQGHCHTGLSGIRDIPGFRVIDCASRKIVPWVKIPEDHDRNYTALSYLWGSDTSTETPDGRIPSPSPKVIEDAVTVTIKLGFRYLWVDRYCIPQHEPVLKAVQMKRMDDVYGSSAVTIVASAGDGPAYGLPGVSSTPRIPLKSARLGSRTLVSVNNDILRTIRKSRWNTRAWTLQEWLLSTRRLFFEDDQVFFQCNQMDRLESIYIPPGEPRTANPATDISLAYLSLRGGLGYLSAHNGIKKGADVIDSLEQYMTRKFNYESDGLRAFEGILRSAARMEIPIYNVWGVLIRPYKKADMTASLVVGLSWRFALAAYRGSRSTDPEKKFVKTWEISYPGPVRRRLFPSWSWVDWAGDFTKKCVYLRQPSELSFVSFSEAYTQSLIQSIAMEYKDGTKISWDSRHQEILHSAKTNEAPRILRIQAYASDVLLWKLPDRDHQDTKERPPSAISSSLLQELSNLSSEDRWVWSDRHRSHCHMLLMYPAGVKSALIDTRNDTLGLCADWLETDRGPSSPTPSRDEYSFRIIILGRIPSPYHPSLLYMVLTRAKQEQGYPAASYERVNLIQRPLPAGLSPGTSLEDLDPKFLRGWTMQETILV